MRSVQRNNDDKRSGRTAGKVKVSRNDVVTPRTPVEEKERLLTQDKKQSPSSPTRAVLSDDEFRARIAYKAYELYQKRQALTEKDDWLEAERLVRLELLNEEHGAGSV
ncbi:hypothetical protein [Nitrospira sp. Nam80]